MSAEEQQKKDEYYMRWALKEAEAAYEEGEIPIGAIVVCRGRIIARAHNMTETLHDVTAHAEMQAITMAADQLGGKYLSDCTLYVTVEPCPMCAGASDGRRYRVLSMEHPTSSEATGPSLLSCYIQRQK